MSATSQNPLALVAELTHRCPLHCVYCSNPLELQSRANELSTEIWSRVFKEAAEAGVLQADLTGGCRCQAMLLAGDATATDPVCSLAPQRPKVDALLAKINDWPTVAAGLAPPVKIPASKIDWLYRTNPA